MLISEMFSHTGVMPPAPRLHPIPFSLSQRYNRECTLCGSFGLVSLFVAEHCQLSKAEGVRHVCVVPPSPQVKHHSRTSVLFSWGFLQVNYSYTHMEWSVSVFHLRPGWWVGWRGCWIHTWDDGSDQSCYSVWVRTMMRIMRSSTAQATAIIIFFYREGETHRNSADDGIPTTAKNPQTKTAALMNPPLY